MRRQVFPAHLDHLHLMLIFIQDYGSEKNLPSDLLNKIILAAEEVLVNIINYAYPQEKGIIEISCEDIDHENSNEKTGIKIVIRDQGIPFNPIERPYAPLSLEKSGGYGIFIYLGMMDQVEYKRIHKENILSLIKYLKYSSRR